MAQIFSNQFTKTLVILYLIIGLSTSPIIISSSWAEESVIPSWIKNNAGWWAEDLITEDEFLKGIEYLINNNIILIDATIDETAYIPTDSQTTKRVPDWVKNNAGWWAEGQIGDYDFLNGIKYLVNKGIILVSIPTSLEAPTIAFQNMLIPGMFLEGAIISNYWQFLKDIQSPVLNHLSNQLHIPNGDIHPSVFDIYGIRNDFTIQEDQQIVWGTPVFGLNPGMMEYYNNFALWNDPQNVVVVFPTFTASAYGERGFYDYFRGECESCTTTTISEKLNYNSSVNGYQLLTLLGYPSITDVNIDKNPSILKKYDKIILLHNEYVTRTMFDAITSHPNVIYLYPNALYAEIEVDYDNNTITLIRGHNYPEPEITNGFDWEFDNTHPFEYDNTCDKMGFYPIDNGWMSNCYPETILPASPIIFKTIKDL